MTKCGKCGRDVGDYAPHAFYPGKGLSWSPIFFLLGWHLSRRYTVLAAPVEIPVCRDCVNGRYNRLLALAVATVLIVLFVTRDLREEEPLFAFCLVLLSAFPFFRLGLFSRQHCGDHLAIRLGKAKFKAQGFNSFFTRLEHGTFRQVPGSGAKPTRFVAGTDGVVDAREVSDQRDKDR